MMLCLKCKNEVQFGVFIHTEMIENGHCICWPCHVMEGEE